MMKIMKGLVLAFGSFDLFHPGHLSYLESARKYGNKLIVIVARDESIKTIKKRTPLFEEKDRLRILKAIRFIDDAVIGIKLKTLEDEYNIIKKYKPSVLAFGYDQKIDEKKLKEWLKHNKINARIVRIKAYNEKKYKSSLIKKKLKI